MENAYEKNKDLPPPNVLLAQILFRGGQGNVARNELQKATENHPNDPAAYIYLGELAFAQRRHPEATMMYNKGLDLCESYSSNAKRKQRLMMSALNGLALLEESKQNWAKAQTYLEQLLKLATAPNTMARLRLGRVLFKQAKDSPDEKKYEQQAYSVFRELHEMDKNATRPEINMGLLYEQDGRRKAAENLMKLALERDGEKHPYATGRWSMGFGGGGNMAMAKQNATQALSLDPRVFRSFGFYGKD